jgi:hypothetical protein
VLIIALRSAAFANFQITFPFQKGVVLAKMCEDLWL